MDYDVEFYNDLNKLIFTAEDCVVPAVGSNIRLGKCWYKVIKVDHYLLPDGGHPVGWLVTRVFLETIRGEV